MLTVHNITKKFPGVTALDKVSLSLEAGKVTALIGENGAGKSTLMKILSGVYTDYEGDIYFKGGPVTFSSPRHAQDVGLAIIHQELNLIPYLSITANIFLGRELTTPSGWLDAAAMETRTRELLSRLQLDVSPAALVADLKVGQQQIVEIAKALLIDADVIIMDEPTSAISDKEVEILFGIIRELKSNQKAVVYISHKLDELFAIADHYVVLRDGTVTGSGCMQDMDHDRLIAAMVGRAVEINGKQTRKQQRTPLLSVRNLTRKEPGKTGRMLLDTVSFDVGKGEIVGLFGLMGAGRTELLEALFGLHPKQVQAAIQMNGKAVVIRQPADAIRAGLALVPEDRKKNGLILELDIKNNVSITTLAAMEKWGLLDDGSARSLTQRYIHELTIKASSMRQKTGSLSGGNQQKIVLAKWLATDPLLLLLDEPTRGIDINAKNEIYKLMLNLAATRDMGILMVSSELPEILAVSDRILVMADGRLTAEFTAGEASEDTILKAAIPKTDYKTAS